MIVRARLPSSLKRLDYLLGLLLVQTLLGVLAGGVCQSKDVRGGLGVQELKRVHPNTVVRQGQLCVVYNRQ